jgi:hypothetical protein
MFRYVLARKKKASTSRSLVTTAWLAEDPFRNLGQRQPSRLRHLVDAISAFLTIRIKNRMICEHCAQPIVESIGDYNYAQSGVSLPNLRYRIILLDITLYRCQCGLGYAIQNLAGLTRLIENLTLKDLRVGVKIWYDEASSTWKRQKLAKVDKEVNKWVNS